MDRDQGSDLECFLFVIPMLLCGHETIEVDPFDYASIGNAVRCCISVTAGTKVAVLHDNHSLSLLHGCASRAIHCDLAK